MAARIIWAGGSLAGEPALLGEATASGATIIRRCVDAADLLAAASLEPSAIVVLTPSVARLDGEVLARIAIGGRVVIGLADDERDAAVLHAWQVPCVIGPESPGRLAAVLESATRSTDGVWAAPIDRPAGSSDARCDAGQAPLIAVWGPSGAPGRSRTALGIADELARDGLTCCLIDADLAAPSLDIDLGVLAETSGLLVAGRQADRGLLTASALRACARTVHGGLSLVTGLPAPHRAADIRPAAMRAILAVARAAYDAVVVDVGACSLQRALPKAATADHDAQDVSDAVLEPATLLVVVARDSPRGLARLLRAWRPMPAPVVVGLVAGRRPGQAIEVIRDAGLTAPLELIRHEERWELAGRAGATLAEVAPRSRARESYRALARHGMGPRV